MPTSRVPLHACPLLEVLLASRVHRLALPVQRPWLPSLQCGDAPSKQYGGSWMGWAVIGSSNRQAQSLATFACFLAQMSLSHMHLSDKDTVPIAAALENNGSLKSLDLSNNDLGEKAAMALGNMLGVSAPALAGQAGSIALLSMTPVAARALD